MCVLLQKKSLIRIVENNDWVIYSILGIAIIYIISSRVLNKDISFVEHLRLSIEDSSNIFINWFISGFIYVFILSVFLSQYIPVVPRFISDHINLGGYTLNKFGFIFITYLLLYGIKCVLSYLFFASSGNADRWKSYTFNINKFFRIIILLFCALTLVHYFYPIDHFRVFNYYIGMLVFIFAGKIAFLLFNRNPTLPKEWYYKFLYICTLQILPHLVVWKFLFF